MTELLNWTELNSLDVFPTFFNWSLNFAIKNSWSEPQSAPSLVFDDCLELFEIINLISVLAIWRCAFVEFVLLEEGVYYDQCISWQTSVSLCPASFCTPRPNLSVTPGISWLPSFAFQSPMMKRTSFLRFLEGLVGLHRIIQLQLLHSYWLQYRLGLPWYWMVRLGNKERSFCHFRDCTQVLHFGFFCWLWGLLHFF